MAEPAFPDLSPGEGWTLVDESVETLFELPAVRVRGATRRYEDRATRDAVHEATGGHDHQWRFLAATRLAFVPSLSPGVVSLISPMIRREATRTFADRFRTRGLDAVERRGTERVRLDTAVRAHLTRFGATDLVGGREIPVAGLVAVWHDRTDYFVVTGGYPSIQLADAFDLADAPDRLAQPPTAYREEFVEQLRAVS